MNLEKLRDDYDWQNALAYAPFGIADIAEVIHITEGENDGPSWVGVFRLNDGRFGCVDAGCDYTGWDCQADGEGFINESLDNLIRFNLTSASRRRLNLELPDLDHIPNRPES